MMTAILTPAMIATLPLDYDFLGASPLMTAFCAVCSEPHLADNMTACPDCHAQVCDDCSPSCSCPRATVMARLAATMRKQVVSLTAEVATLQATAAVRELKKREKEQLTSAQLLLAKNNARLAILDYKMLLAQ